MVLLLRFMPILKLVLTVNQTLFRKSGMVPQNFFEWGLRDFTFASTKRMVMVHIHFSCLSMCSKLIVCAKAYAIVIKVEIDRFISKLYPAQPLPQIQPGLSWFHFQKIQAEHPEQYNMKMKNKVVLVNENAPKIIRPKHF